MTGREKFKQYRDLNDKFYAAEIMSTPYLKDGRYAFTGEGTFHMILTHIVKKDSEYASYYKQEKGLKLLDNSLFELGYALPAEDVIKAAELVEADILVSPDVIRDGEATVENAKAFTQHLKELGVLDKYAVMAVPQGKSVKEWMDCYSELVKIEGIDCIGLSIIGMITSMQDVTGTEDIVTNRTAFMSVLEKWEGIDTAKWHHLLGLGRGPFELTSYKHLEWVRSNDSSNAWWHGWNNVQYSTDSKGKLEEKLKLEVDFAAPVKSDVHDVVMYNLTDQRHIVNYINERRGVK